MAETAVKVIGVAVVEHDGRYLVGVRGAEGPLAGYAEFPGGKCLDGESPRACAERECLEETGLRVVARELLLRRRYDYLHGAVDLHFWLCTPLEAADISERHNGYQWIAALELGALRFPEANAPLIELLRARR